MESEACEICDSEALCLAVYRPISPTEEGEHELQEALTCKECYTEKFIRGGIDGKIDHEKTLIFYGRSQRRA